MEKTKLAWSEMSKDCPLNETKDDTPQTNRTTKKNRLQEYECFVNTRIAPSDSRKVVNFLILISSYELGNCTCEADTNTNKLDFKINGKLIFSVDKAGEENLESIEDTLQSKINEVCDYDTFDFYANYNNTTPSINSQKH